MRQGVMRQAEKAPWLRTDPGLENWICAGYAPGTKTSWWTKIKRKKFRKKKKRNKERKRERQTD